MKKILISLLLVGYSLLSFSQPFTNEVGIDEHLNDTVPLNLAFINEQNQSVTLGQLINKPTILAFVYFDCPGLCSPLQEGISDLVDKSDLVLGKDYNIITISFNYKDTPEKAIQKKANFTTKIGKDKAPYWYYLTGDSLAIVKILNSVGYKIKVAGVDYIHPSAIIMLSPKGKITRYLYGLTFLPFDLKMSVIEARKGISQPTINRVLQFCYTYEPEGRRYTLEITKLVGVFTLIVIAALFIVLVSRRKKKD
ncbi:MAG: SCO family protein [Bacteroidales bacterium]|nr:SCO family protein [Bacteroidales bacterium]